MTTATLPPIQRLDRLNIGTNAARPRRTKSYRPQIIGSDWYGAALDGRPVFTIQQGERMRRTPQIQLGLRILRAPMYQVPKLTTVEADSPRVGKFVLEQFRNFWEHSARRLLTSTFTFGYSPGETTYRVSRGLEVFDRWDDVHPRDARPLEWNKGLDKGEFAGVRVRGGSHESPTSGPAAFDLTTPHAFWFSGEAEYGSYYGRARLAGAFEPWLEKHGREGAVDCRRLWFQKGAFTGGSIRYPMGFTEVEKSDGTTTSINNQDLAREIAEKFRTGGVLSLPAIRDMKTGEYLWQFEPPKSGGEVGNLIEYPKVLDAEILRGLGIPPEIVDAATVGSGYSGRAIPAQVFFSACDEVTQMLVDTIDRQAIRHMVKLNYRNARYRIRVGSLAELVAREPGQAGQMANEPDERQDMGGPVFGGKQEPKPPEVSLSHEATKKLSRRLRKFEKLLDLGWVPARTKEGHIKAIGTGQHAGQTLYGDDATRALSPDQQSKVSDNNKPGHHPTTEELDALHREVPEVDRGAWSKIKETYTAVRNAVLVKSIKLMQLADTMAPAILDTADDFMNMKAAAYGDLDSWKDATGISWGFTQTLVKHAIGVGFRLAGHRATDMGFSDQAITLGVEVLGSALRAALGDKVEVKDDELRALLEKRACKTDECEGESLSFDEAKHKRGQPKNAGQFGPGGSNGKASGDGSESKTATPPKEKQGGQESKVARRVEEAQPKSDKAARAKAAHVMVNKDIQRYAEEHNEPRFAKAVGGVSSSDGQPLDIAIGKNVRIAPDGSIQADRLDGGVELKTMVANGNMKITMDTYSQIRKVEWCRAHNVPFHTVVIDDHEVYNSNGDNQHGDESKRVYYYRRGVAGSARVQGMYKCTSLAELKKLMKADESALPDAAKPTDGKLRVGRWKPFTDETGKGFTNSKTGQVIRAKK